MVYSNIIWFSSATGEMVSHGVLYNKKQSYYGKKATMVTKASELF